MHSITALFCCGRDMIGPGIGKGRIEGIGFTGAVSGSGRKSLCGGGEAVSGSFEEGLFLCVSVFGVGERINVM
jgi:hypothetical protein